MAKSPLEKFSHRAELQDVIKEFDAIEDRHPELSSAVKPIRETISIRLAPAYARIATSEQCNIMTEVSVIYQADKDMTEFQENKDVQRDIIRRVNEIHPKFD